MHDLGSMGTLHANSPREALSRVESMITMGGFSLPSRTIREMIVSSIDVIVQAARLRDGSRRITHITEVIGPGRRRHHHPGSVRLRDRRRGRAGQARRSASLDRHRPSEASGIARAITARRSGSRPHSTPPKSRARRIRDACHGPRCLLAACSRWWRPRRLVCAALSVIVGRAARPRSGAKACPAAGTAPRRTRRGHRRSPPRAGRGERLKELEAAAGKKEALRCQ